MDEPSWIYYDNESCIDAEPHKVRKSQFIGRRSAKIEAFHSILEHDVIERSVFDSYYEAKEMLKRYFSCYNYCRLRRSINFITPQQKWKEAQVMYDTTFSENLSS